MAVNNNVHCATWFNRRYRIEVLNRCSSIPGRGLPPSMEDIYLIEQARQRRSVEDSLPPISKETVDLYRVVYDKLESCKWLLREEVLDR